MVSLLGILCKARNNSRARDLGESREEGCQWWCPFWRRPVIIPGPVAQTPFSGFSTSGKHPACQGTWGSRSLPASSPLLPLCSFWFTFTHLLAAHLCPVVACSEVNFPTASSPVPFIQWFLHLSFKPPVRYHFHADSPEPWTFSQTFTEGFPCTEHFTRVISHNALGSPMRQTLSIFLQKMKPQPKEVTLPAQVFIAPKPGLN